jgi:hypothetical protein
MGRPLDPTITSTLMTQQVIRTTYIVDIAALAYRSFTNYPGGIICPNIVAAIAVTNGGSGYAAAPLVTITSGTGQGALAYAVISGGVVTSVIVIGRGWGYATAPSVGFSGGGGTGAAATATIGMSYTWADLRMANVTEIADGSVIQATLQLGDTQNNFTDLVTDSGNCNVPVSIQKVWR